MYHVYYCVIRSSVKILTHFEIQCTVRLMQKDRCMYRLLVGWLNPHVTQLTPALQDCPLWGTYLLAWAVGSSAEGSCVSNGRVNICALNLSF